MRRLARRARVLLLTTPAQRRAHALAVARLDARRPGWEHELVLGALRMSSGVHCVLGQLYGEYGAGLRTLYGVWHYRSFAINPGLRAFDARFPRLLWLTEVRDRRERAAVVPPDDPPTAVVDDACDDHESCPGCSLVHVLTDAP